LFAILREARRRGYAENVDETALGLHCLAVPVGPPGRVAAAATLCVPTGRMTAARRREMLPDLLRAAREMVSAPGNGDRPPRPNTSPNQSSKLDILATSAPTYPGRRRLDSNRKVAP
jgi:Bacterial transcriptional regulator